MLRMSVGALVLLIVLILGSGLGAAASPDQALANPVYLGEWPETRMVFGSFALETSELLIAYVEYDDVVDGHGAFVFRTGGREGDSRFSFLASKEMSNARLGMGVHRVSGEDTAWLIDAAVAYTIEQVMLWAGIYDLPLTKWDELKEFRGAAAGVSVNITPMINAGVEARMGSSVSLTGSVTINIQQDLKARVYAVVSESALSSGGLEGWYTRDSMLLYVGYARDVEGSGHLRVGVGFQF